MYQSSSSSSSSIDCGAGDHKVSPCTTIISICGNLLFLHCSFIIPKQSLYITKVWSTWSTRSPFANGWDVSIYIYMYINADDGNIMWVTHHAGSNIETVKVGKVLFQLLCFVSFYYWYIYGNVLIITRAGLGSHC